MRLAAPGLYGSQRDLRLVLVERDAADHDVLHVLRFFFHNRTWVVVETGADLEHDAELLGELDGARLHDLGAEAGQFEHFVVGDLRQLAGSLHDARISGVNAIDVRVDLAEIGLDRRRQRDGRKVGTAAAERGDLPLAGLPLEAGDNHDVATIEQLVDALRRDVLNFGLGVNAIGDDARLRAGQ